MKLLPISRSSSMIGLDIQASGIYLLQLHKYRQNYTVQKAAIINLPSQWVIDNKIKYFEEFTQLLKNAVRELNLHKNQSAAICIPFDSVRFQHLQLYKHFSKETLEAEIRTRMMNDFPRLNDDFYLDYSEFPFYKKNQTDIFLALTRQEYLNQYINCVYTAGLKVKIADVDIYAIQRAFCHQLNLTWSQASAYALVHRVNNKIFLIVFNEYEIIFQQSWQLKLLNHLLEEVQKKLQIYETSFPNVQILSIIFLTPSNAYLKFEDASNFAQYQLLQTKPFQNLEFDSLHDKQLVNDHQDEFIIPYGLAMREVSKC